MPTTEVSIWEAILRPHFGQMSSETARSILALSFPEKDRVRMKELMAKLKASKLSREEALELDEFERTGNTLSVLKARARRVLRPKKA